MTKLNHAHTHPELLHFRAVVAALLSVVPGLGHIYKAHYRTGLELMIISPFFIWVGILLGWATAGIGLLVPVIYMVMVGWHAYSVEDKRHHLIGIF